MRRASLVSLVLLLACATSRPARLDGADAALEGELAREERRRSSTRSAPRRPPRATTRARPLRSAGSRTSSPAPRTRPPRSSRRGSRRRAASGSRPRSRASRRSSRATPTRPEALEARFRAAECQYHLGARRRGARGPRRDPGRRRAACRGADPRPRPARRASSSRTGAQGEAERTLARGARHLRGRERARAARRPTTRPRRAFHLGELHRAAFEAAPLDPVPRRRRRPRAASSSGRRTSSSPPRASTSARSGWATGAGRSPPGARVGELYEAFRAELLAAPLPPGLGDAEAELYRAELAREVRVLAAKAITAYEETLAAARNAGVDDVALLDETREALERLRAVAAEPEPEGASAR